MPITSRTFIRSTTALLLVGLVALVAIVATAFWLGVRTQNAFEGVLAARNLRAAAIDLRGALQDAETSQRGFLLTGRDEYLAPYTTANAAIPGQVAQLAAMIGGDPELGGQWTTARQAIAGKVDELAQTIALKQAGRDAEALALVNTDRGKALMDQARLAFGVIIDVAENRIGAAVADQQQSSAELAWVAIIGAAVILLVVGGSALTVLRYTRQLIEAQDEVAALNTGLERRVRERTADLAQANDEIQRFAYIVTHDLRAPLVNIMGFTAELEAGLLQIRAYFARLDTPGDDPVAAEAHKATDAELPEAIGFIRSSTRKMDALISAILKLAREGGRVLRPEQVDLHAVLEASSNAIRHQLTEAAGEIELDVDAPPILSDRLALEQIFGNLLDNAVKYRATGRPLRISVKARRIGADRVEIKITDNGRGIAAQDHERVFELFRRSGTQDQPGEGIGLPYVRRIVRNLGGDIGMVSTLGEGTSFVITMPRALATATGDRI